MHQPLLPDSGADFLPGTVPAPRSVSTLRGFLFPLGRKGHGNRAYTERRKKDDERESEP